MRLGQLARKYDVSIQEIITYLNEIEPEHGKLHSNSKLNEELEERVVKEFGELEIEGDSTNEDEPILKVQDEPETSPEKVEDEVVEIEHEEEPAEEPVVVVHEIEIEQEEENELVVEEKTNLESVQTPPESTLQVEASEKAEAIDSDKLLELLDSEEEAPINLEKITLIKAPKKELEGLKVVGKIDIEEPQNVEEQPKEQKPEETEEEKAHRLERRRLRAEEMETSRARNKKRKEEQEARQLERKKEKEKKQLREKRESHYKQKLQQAKVTQKKKDKVKKPVRSVDVVDEMPKPKTALGRFWRWLNT